MTMHKDFTGRWRLDGFESIDFSTEQDARNAAALAKAHADELVSAAGSQEYRYRRASKRAKEATEVSHV